MLLYELFSTGIYEDTSIIEDVQQPWGDLEDMDPHQQYRHLHDTASDLKQTLDRNLSLAAEKATGVKGAKVITDIKSFPSFKNKVYQRGYAPSKLTDVLRATVLVKKRSDMEEVADSIQKMFDVISYEVKSKPDNKFGFFGPHVFIVELDGVAIEVQLMTRRMKAFSKEAHKIYQKYRADSDNPEKNYSKELFRKANLPIEIPSKKQKSLSQ